MKRRKYSRVTVPRNDLGVTVDEWQMPPFMGLTTWAAFIDGTEKDAMVTSNPSQRAA